MRTQDIVIGNTYVMRSSGMDVRVSSTIKKQGYVDLLEVESVTSGRKSTVSAAQLDVQDEGLE